MNLLGGIRFGGEWTRTTDNTGMSHG